MIFNFATRKVAIIAATAIAFSMTTVAFAGGPDRMAMPSEPSQSTNHLWSAIISTGYTNYSHMYAGDGQTPIARLAIARSFKTTASHWGFGIETGVQTGNTMRLENSQATFNLLGAFSPIQTTVKPMLDLLLTAKKSFSDNPLFLIGKAGIAYRRWQFDNVNTINDLSEINAEAQMGVGYQINERTDLDFLYQGIFGGNPNFTANIATGTGHVSDIPIQQGACLSLSVGV